MRAALLVALAAGCAQDPTTTLSVDRVEAVATVSPGYLSFAIDTSRIVRGYDVRSPRLVALARALGPTTLRIGGTDADTVYYNLGDAPPATPPPPYRHVLDRATWDGVCDLALAADLQILFTLNAGPGPRDAEGHWQPDNARALLAYSQARSCPVAVWELGNEVNAFAVAHGLGAAVSGETYAADVARARTLVDEVTPGARLAGPASIYWPLVGELPRFLPDALPGAGAALDVLTWHYYPQQSSLCPFANRPAALDTLLAPDALDEAGRWADAVAALRDQHAPLAEIWLGETGHALCGGEEGLSDRFVAGFWWLDQLGLLARRGQAVSVRQALVGGRYHLVEDEGLEPRPDYFNSLLWRRLMGERVLAIAAAPAVPSLRVYAHCTPGAPGSVTVLAINLSPTRTEHIALEEPLGTARDVYALTSPDLTSVELRLNGARLAVAPDGSPPALTPRRTSDPIALAPLSYAFIVAPDAAAPACLGAW